MKNKLKFIPFLLAVPLLFMANSPAPSSDVPPAMPYSDYQLSDLVFESADENGKYPFSLNIENTGDLYINLDFSSYDRTYDFTNDINLEKLCLAPHTSGTFSSIAPADSVFTLENNKFTCYAHRVDGILEYESIALLEKIERVDGLFGYKFKINNPEYVLNETRNNSEKVSAPPYLSIVDLSIKGEKVSFYQGGATPQEELYIAVKNGSLTEEDFVFEKISLSKEPEPPTPPGGGRGGFSIANFFYGVLIVFITILQSPLIIIWLLGGGIIIAGLVVGIIFIVNAIKKRRT